MDDARPLLEEVLEAHGGRTLWEGLEAVEAELSAWGLLFAAKRRPTLERVRVTAFAREPRFVFHGVPRPGLVSELVGEEEVRIREEGGRILERRERPRAAFRGLRRLASWDALDFAYFGGYATWNYLLTPWLLLGDGFGLERRDTPRGLPESWVRLRARFPAGVPTHCREQDFYFDEHRRLRRLDYTAEVVGGWAHAAHLCEEYREFEGLRAPTRRRVYPLLFGTRPLPAPLLVGIDIHRLAPVRQQGRGI